MLSFERLECIQDGNRDNWKGAFELVSALKEPGDIVVVTEQRIGDYYLEGDLTNNFNYLDYDTLAESNQRYWFIEDNNLGEKEPEILEWVKDNSELISNKDVAVRAREFKMRIYLYDPAEQ